MSRIKKNTQYIALKSIIDLYFSTLVGLFVLWILSPSHESYSIKYLILCIWIILFCASVPSACIMVLFYQDNYEFDMETTSCLETIRYLNIQRIRELCKFQWSNSPSIRDHLCARAGLIAMAGGVSSILTLSIFLVEYELELSKSYLVLYLNDVHLVMCCWWLCALFSGLSFGGYKVTETHHRLAAPFETCHMAS
jgi:hypothetical protein